MGRARGRGARARGSCEQGFSSAQWPSHHPTGGRVGSQVARAEALRDRCKFTQFPVSVCSPHPGWEPRCEGLAWAPARASARPVLPRRSLRSGFWCAACCQCQSWLRTALGLGCLCASQPGFPLGRGSARPSVELLVKQVGPGLSLSPGWGACWGSCGKPVGGPVSVHPFHPVSGLNKCVLTPHEWGPGFPQPFCYCHDCQPAKGTCLPEVRPQDWGTQNVLKPLSPLSGAQTPIQLLLFPSCLTLGGPF